MHIVYMNFCSWVFDRFVLLTFLGREPTASIIFILLTPLNNHTTMKKEKSQANSWWRRSSLALAVPLDFGRCPWHWWRPLGPVTTLFPSTSSIARHILLLLSICSLSFISSFAKRSAFCFFFLPLSPFLFLSVLFIYSFGLAAALCPLARRPVGCPLVAGRCSFEYFCSRNSNVRRRPAQASIQWPTTAGRREKERGSTYLAGR